MRIRIYGKDLNSWYTTNEHGRRVCVQTEIAYKEYDSETCELLGVGSEDFSPTRERSTVDHAWVWTWDGQRLNKGGYRWFENMGYIRFRKSDRKGVKEYLFNKYKPIVLNLRK